MSASHCSPSERPWGALIAGDLQGVSWKDTGAECCKAKQSVLRSVCSEVCI